MNILKTRYESYRRWGHGPFAAAVLAVPPQVFWPVAAFSFVMASFIFSWARGY